MQFVNNETGKTVATLPDFTKNDEVALAKMKQEQKRVAKEWGAKIKKEMGKMKPPLRKLHKNWLSWNGTIVQLSAF